MSNQSAKRAKKNGVEENEEVLMDLLGLYEGDLDVRLLSYASASDLCTIDATSRRFRSLTTDPWNNITGARFGMKNGKEGWRIGTSFLRNSFSMHMTDDQDHGYGDGYMGTASVATNGSIIVAVADDVNGNTDSRTFPNERDGIGIRDAFSLNYFRTLPSPIENWKVAICGRVGSEMIVTSNYTRICAIRGNDTQRCYRGYGLPRNGNGIPIIGSETHLIAATYCKIVVYRVNPVGEAGGEGDHADLLSMQTSKIHFPKTDGTIMSNMAWGPGKTHFIGCYPHEICVWMFDALSGNPRLVTAILTADVHITGIALANDSIVGSCKDKKVHVWHRDSCEKLHVLCDVDEDDESDDESDEDEFEGQLPLSMSCHGHILVSTSRIGCALCIWDIKSGVLLKRYNHAENEHFVDMLPDGHDATDMVYLERLNAFLCMQSYMNIWSFPTNQRQYDMASSIRRREERLRKALYL